MTDEALSERVTATSDAGSKPAAGGVELARPKAAEQASKLDRKRVAFILLGLALFTLVYFAPTPDPAVDPEGRAFTLTREGKAALALFFLAATWWVTEVIPIGVTSITIGVVQALFLIRPARVAFTDFMDPSVWFIFGSLVFGMVFTKTGLTRRLAYKMLSLVGEGRA